MKRTFSKGRVLIALFSALLLLQRPVSQNTTKTSASAAYWQETTTIESGKHYIIAALAADGKSLYYLQAQEYYDNEPEALPLDFNDIKVSDAWTFTESNENTYVITDNAGHILFNNGTNSGVRSRLVVHTSWVANQYWTYVDHKLTTSNERFLTLYKDSDNSKWRSLKTGVVAPFHQTIKLYTLTDAGEANDFGTKFLSITDGECSDKNVLSDTWDELEEMYNNTSSAVKTIIISAIPNVNGSDLEHALMRYSHIVAAYGYADFLNLTNNQAIKVTNPPQNSILPNVIMISTIGISVTLGYYFILKKTIKE